MAVAQSLYTPEILAETIRLADFPWDDALPLTGSARSPTCGSSIALGLALDETGAIARLGIRPHACAVGQAAASLFAQHGAGCTRTQIAAAREEIATWLAGGDACPTWPGFALLGRARAYPARHGAILLAWDAALDAFAVHAG